MRPVHRRLFTLAAATCIAGAGNLVAQTPNIRVAGRIQTQFSAISGDSSSAFNPSGVVTTAFDTRRLRIQADVRIGENINLVVQPSFEMGALRMRDAYLRVLLARTATSAFGLSMGQEKKPFNRYELTSSNTLPSIERGLRLRGFSGTPAVQNNLLEAEGYLAHDLGASLDWYGASNRATVKLGVYNGSGESAADVNNAKTYVARATYTAMLDAEARPVLRLGAAWMSRDRAVTTTATSTAFAPDSSRSTSAFGLEFEYGDFRPGLHVIADLMTGDALAAGTHCLNGATAISCRFATGRNTGNVRPNAPDSAFTTFRSLHLVGAWRLQPADPDGTRLIKILEPALRIDFTDPNTDADNDNGLLITPAVNVHFSPTTVMRVGLDLYRYKDAAGASQSVRAFRVSWQSNF
jgi:hypothetical protein